MIKTANVALVGAKVPTQAQSLSQNAKYADTPAIAPIVGSQSRAVRHRADVRPNQLQLYKRDIQNERAVVGACATAEGTRLLNCHPIGRASPRSNLDRPWQPKPVSPPLLRVRKGEGLEARHAGVSSVAPTNWACRQAADPAIATRAASTPGAAPTPQSFAASNLSGAEPAVSGSSPLRGPAWSRAHSPYATSISLRDLQRQLD